MFDDDFLSKIDFRQPNGANLKVTTLGDEVQRCVGSGTVSPKVGGVYARDQVLIANFRPLFSRYDLRIRSYGC